MRRSRKEDLNIPCLKKILSKRFFKNQSFSKTDNRKFIAYALDSLSDVTICLDNRIKYIIVNTPLNQ